MGAIRKPNRNREIGRRYRLGGLCCRRALADEVNAPHALKPLQACTHRAALNAIQVGSARNYARGTFRLLAQLVQHPRGAKARCMSKQRNRVVDTSKLLRLPIVDNPPATQRRRSRTEANELLLADVCDEPRDGTAPSSSKITLAAIATRRCGKAAGPTRAPMHFSRWQRCHPVTRCCQNGYGCFVVSFFFGVQTI